MTTEPVVFDPFSEAFFGDPYPTSQRMRDEAPVSYDPDLDFFALSRDDDVTFGQKDYSALSSAFGIELTTVKSGKKSELSMLIMLDPPAHRRMLGVPEGERQQIRLWLDEALTRGPGGVSTPAGEEARSLADPLRRAGEDDDLVLGGKPAGRRWTPTRAARNF